MAISNEEKTAAMQLFHLKAKLREKMEEWQKSAETAKLPQTKKWYLFFAQDLEKLYQDHLLNCPVYQSYK